jgi:hypothetical protein
MSFSPQIPVSLQKQHADGDGDGDRYLTVDGVTNK